MTTKESTDDSNSGAPKPVDVKTIQSILSVNDSARVKTWLNLCSRCGLCAESCFVYLSNDKDPTLSPAYKFKSTIGEMYRRKGRVDRAFIEKCLPPLWYHCTTCKRCSMYCPFGIDIATLISLGRHVCYSQGVVPDKLAFFTDNCQKSGNHMDLPKEELLDTCEWMVEEAEDDYSGITIPIDQKGATYMYTINPREPVFYPQELGLAAIIFSVAGVSWTLPTFGWDCTNLPMFAGNRAVGGQQVRNVYDMARELGCQKILITECGHAFRSLAFEGPYMAGYMDGRPPVDIVHSIQLLYELVRDGRIAIDPAKKLKEPVTYQDPCNVSRNGGLWEIGRKLIGYLCEDYREMSPNREHNHCCGGGGGILPMGPDYKPIRIANGKVKAEQIRETGAKVVIAPCHNCFDQVNDLGEEYDLDIKVLSFKELIVDMMILPDRFKPKDG
jgi:Fe-S oxidoreductase